ncbi:HTH domain-containing protein [Virgibacillus salarius]|uniref:HTH domain-containing protein n=1 Tax=Virgibacillus salarius TaxID=447199 RepID=UPI002491BC28|nr:HTH domain-containing protein [Virgibacillus salarius]WBX82122.1 HTH domain-containing protein [Virgibacillus salarius]
MNNRQRELIEILLSNDSKPFLIQDLATHVQCSEKTVRNDLKQIEDYVRTFSSASIVRKPGTGVYLDINNVERKKLFRNYLRRQYLKMSEQ